MKRPCGCGERGRHRPICNLAGISKPKVIKEPRTCGCSQRGRHKPTCELSHVRIIDEDVYRGVTDIHELYTIAYGEKPHLTWYPNKAKQRTIENRIAKLVKKYKPFYVITEDETWYVDGGNWVTVVNGLREGTPIGHVKNCMEFLK